MFHHTTVRSLAGLAGWALLVAAAAVVGGLGSADAPEFYRALDRPAWTPPVAAFGPVWTTLYTLMAIAAWLVWRERGLGGAPLALGLFVVQLVLNALWSWLFFVAQSGVLAAAEIALLWLAIVANIALFWRIRPLAGALLLPYLAWVTLAAALTLSLWQRNPQLLG